MHPSSLAYCAASQDLVYVFCNEYKRLQDRSTGASSVASESPERSSFRLVYCISNVQPLSFERHIAIIPARIKQWRSLWSSKRASAVTRRMISPTHTAPASNDP